jgi:hypothetical protein
MRRFFLPVLLAFCFMTPAMAQAAPRYLAFQIFTPAPDAPAMQQNLPPTQNWPMTVIELKNRIGATRSDVNRLAFMLGPIAFDQSDDYVRALISKGFEVALQTGVAFGVHIDDSMFWGRLKELNTPDNIEWLDWNKTLNTGRRLDWSSNPASIMPQLCINSPAVKQAVAARAALIGAEISKGIKKLQAAGKADLYAGVIAGSETMIGYDAKTGKELGYCALTNAGFSATNPPADINRERINIVRNFMDFWAESLINAGVPKGTVYSHITFAPEVTNLTPPETAFCSHCVPGISTYPAPGHLELWSAELSKHGNPAWASAEGTAIDPAQAEHGGSGSDMEAYLGRLYNHGAQLVTIYGWGVGDGTNAFRKTAENNNSVVAYRKFLKGQPLAEAPAAGAPQSLPDKIHKIQAALPTYLQANGPSKVQPLMQKLQTYIESQQFDKASPVADEVLKLLGIQ